MSSFKIMHFLGGVQCVSFLTLRINLIKVSELIAFGLPMENLDTLEFLQEEKD
jgi:hypothetical protein